MSVSKKFKLYVEDNWNKCDMVAISLFVVGVVCRQEKLNGCTVQGYASESEEVTLLFLQDGERHL